LLTGFVLPSLQLQLLAAGLAAAKPPLSGRQRRLRIKATAAAAAAAATNTGCARPLGRYTFIRTNKHNQRMPFARY